MTDKFHEECGVFGVFKHEDAARITYLGLYALQHRGQESAGIVSTDGRQLYVERGMGHVAEIFEEGTLSRLKGDVAIGHTRYSTAGDSSIKNAQPIEVSCSKGQLALCHNGNLVNAEPLRRCLENDGSIFQSTSDSEVVLHLIAKSRCPTIEEAIQDSLQQVSGAYSLIFLTPEKMIAVRDPRGFRPLCFGWLDGSPVLGSETCAFDLIGAKFEREVEPGEMIVFSEQGWTCRRIFPEVKPSFCIFEHVYFSRPDSVVFGRSVYESRYLLGKYLAMEQPAAADIVVPVPDSGVTAAIGFSKESGIPFEFGLIRNHYVGRTFIEPKQAIRHFGVKIKLNPVADLIRGKRVVLVDDSIVRGTTSRKIVKMVRAAGATEVHMRISCPPTKSPCYYGVDTPTKRELIASSHSVDEICKYIGADSLGYLSLEGMLKACGDTSGKGNYCTACYTGRYPVEFPRNDLLKIAQKTLA
ncbi:MAG TPA: amidophosphoribosyltransferase [Terriglobia bacterium]|nr:amidophosphoribosyltransferase [Terriglobia bacterium]